MKKEPKPSNIELGRRVQQYRLRAELTREQLAERTGISPRFVADIEVGNVGVSTSTLKNLCRVLEVSADALLFGEPAGIDALLRGLGAECVDSIRELVVLQLKILKP